MAFRDEARLLTCTKGWWWLEFREGWGTGFKYNIQCITPPEEGDSGRVAGVVQASLSMRTCQGKQRANASIADQQVVSDCQAQVCEPHATLHGSCVRQLCSWNKVSVLSLDNFLHNHSHLGIHTEAAIRGSSTSRV